MQDSIFITGRQIAWCILHSAIGIFLFSCYSSRDLSNRNLSDIYHKSEQVFHPEFAVVHRTDTSSVLYVKVNPKEFLYMRQADDRFKASFNIHYNLLESYEST